MPNACMLCAFWFQLVEPVKAVDRGVCCDYCTDTTQRPWYNLALSDNIVMTRLGM